MSNVKRMKKTQTLLQIDSTLISKFLFCANLHPKVGVYFGDNQIISPQSFDLWTNS